MADHDGIDRARLFWRHGFIFGGRRPFSTLGGKACHPVHRIIGYGNYTLKVSIGILEEDHFSGIFDIIDAVDRCRIGRICGRRQSAVDQLGLYLVATFRDDETSRRAGRCVVL